jgi:uncharacterized membrane protein (DUF4010 family)
LDQATLFTRLAVALGIGLLVGLERGWHSRDEEEHQRAAGFRTFALSGLLGGVAGIIALDIGDLFLGFVFLAYTAVFSAFHWLEARASKSLSVTSVIAGMLTFLLGTVAVVGDVRVAIAGTVAMTVLLALREQLHRWVASLTWQEIRAVLILLAMSSLLLPILPDRTIDPWSAVNPHQVWLLAIMMAGISFGGYVAVRTFGDRLGVVMAAIAGGLASSTATTLILARLGRAHPEATRLTSAGILIAGTVMILRVAMVALVLNASLLEQLLPPLAAAGIILAVAAIILLFRSSGTEHADLRIANPLEIWTALRLAAFIVVVSVAAKLLLHAFGDIGVLLLAGLSGVADVDAVTLSMARLGGAGLDLHVAGRAILIVAAVNTATKASMAAWIGGRQIGFQVATASAAALFAGIAAAIW